MIALSGIPLAQADFKSSRDGDRYKIEAKIDSLALINIIAETRATAMSTGVVVNGDLKPDRFYLKYKQGRRQRLFDTGFAHGDVVSSVIEPKPGLPRKPGWIEPTADDLKGVTDPVAGLILPAEKNPCPQTLPVFDGETRLDLQLTAKGETNFRADGFDGKAITCDMRYLPKSGYRKGRDDIEYIRKVTMEIWFAKSARMDVYAPVFISVPTRYGRLTITATRFDG
jgi:hypothetical protein